jgi:hypothetical protein
LEISRRTVMYSDNRLAEYVFINWFQKNNNAKLIDFMRLSHSFWFSGDCFKEEIKNPNLIRFGFKLFDFGIIVQKLF